MQKVLLFCSIFLVFCVLIGLNYATSIPTEVDEFVGLLNPLQERYPSNSTWKYQSEGTEIESYYRSQFAIAPILLGTSIESDTFLTLSRIEQPFSIERGVKILEESSSKNWHFQLQVRNK